MAVLSVPIGLASLPRYAPREGSALTRTKFEMFSKHFFLIATYHKQYLTDLRTLNSTATGL